MTDRVPLVATRFGYVLSRRRALGLEPRAAGDRSISSRKLQKIPKSFARASKSLQKIPIFSKKFDRVTKIYQWLTDENRSERLQKYFRDAERRGPRPVINISAPVFLRCASLEAAIEDLRAGSGRVRGERTRAFSVATLRT
jgi:hypothetical protein